MAPFPPKENVRPAARRTLAKGGTGTSWKFLVFNDEETSSCVVPSADDGRVDEELKRVEDELSYNREVAADRSVPPLLLRRS